MGKVKYKLSATVPVVQYGNLIPEIEVEVDSIEEGENMVLPYIEDFFNKYSEKKKIGAAKRATTEGRVKETDIFGNDIFYDDAKHEYSNALGEVYLSGSQYAKEEEFDKEYWAQDAVEKYGLDPKMKDEILRMWDVNAATSNSFGTALHAAIELHGEFRNLANIIDIDKRTGNRKKLSAKIDKNSSLPKLPYLKEAVIKFFDEERSKQKAKYEVLVVDHKNKRAGRIDRLVRNEDGTYSICDMKTNYKILKPEKTTYGKQLSFYADIMIANGAKMSETDMLKLHHWKDGEWIDIPLPKVDTL